MKTRKLLIAVLFISACSMNAQVVINVDATQKGPKISPTHYGIFYEDINHAADGGLYAELIRNRSFEDDLMGGGRNMRRRGGQNNQNEGQTEPRVSNWFSVGDASSQNSFRKTF